MTIGKLYGPAMEITEQEAADSYLDRLVAYCQGEDPLLGRTKALEIQRANLGYYAGYYDNETRARVERLFRCAHPVFGPIAVNGAPTQEEVFQAGVKAGRNARRGK